VSTATLAGHRVTHARVTLPAWGAFWAEVSLDEEVSLSGRVALSVADLQLSGTVMSGGPGPKGRSSFRLAGGAGAWGKKIPAKSYANDAGVKASTILVDAAKACGETLDPTTIPDVRLGPAWTREEAVAARALEQIAPAGWYVGQDGTTRIGKRPPTTLTTPASIGPVDQARRCVPLAADAIAAIVPGVVVEGIEAADVLHELTPSGLRSTIWGKGPADTSRELAAFRRLLEQLDPARRFRGIYEYRIVTQDGDRVNLQPIRISTGMPDLQRVVVRPGIPGARADHTLGARVLVGFVDADPARPVVVGFEDAEGGGFVPTQLYLGGPLTLAAARFSDTVQAGPFVGTITSGSTEVRIG
jgi:hypothetical protein